jgi:hypothetical protein
VTEGLGAVSVDGDSVGGGGESVGGGSEEGEEEGGGGDGDGEVDGGGSVGSGGIEGGGCDEGGEFDGDGERDGGGDGRLDVTVQLKLTEPASRPGYVAVTVTPYVPEAVFAMVPVINPLPLIDRPGGRCDAVKCGGCPAAALSDLTCNRTAVPGAVR